MSFYRIKAIIPTGNASLCGINKYTSDPRYPGTRTRSSSFPYCTIWGGKKSRARWVVEMVKHQSIHVVDVEGNTNQDVETDSGNELSEGGEGASEASETSAFLPTDLQLLKEKENDLWRKLLYLSFPFSLLPSFLTAFLPISSHPSKKKRREQFSLGFSPCFSYIISCAGGTRSSAFT